MKTLSMQTLMSVKEIELVGNKLSMWLFSSNVCHVKNLIEMYQLTLGENFMPLRSAPWTFTAFIELVLLLNRLIW